MNCYGKCEHLDKKGVMCRLTGTPLATIRFSWGVVYQHEGYCGHEHGNGEGKALFMPRE